MKLPPLRRASATPNRDATRTVRCSAPASATPCSPATLDNPYTLSGPVGSLSTYAVTGVSAPFAGGALSPENT